MLDLHQSGNDTGHGHGQRSGAAQGGNDFAVLDKHVPAGFERSSFAEINRQSFVFLRQIEQQKPTAAYSGGLWPEHADGKGCRHRGINRIASPAEHGSPGFACRRVCGNDHTVLGG